MENSIWFFKQLIVSFSLGLKLLNLNMTPACFACFRGLIKMEWDLSFQLVLFVDGLSVDGDIADSLKLGLPHDLWLSWLFQIGNVYWLIFSIHNVRHTISVDPCSKSDVLSRTVNFPFFFQSLFSGAVQAPQSDGTPGAQCRPGLTFVECRHCKMIGFSIDHDVWNGFGWCGLSIFLRVAIFIQFIYIGKDVIHILAHKLTHMIDKIYICNNNTHHGDTIVNDGSMAEIRLFLKMLAASPGVDTCRCVLMEVTSWFSISRTCGNVGSLAHGEMMWDALLLLRLTHERLRMMWEWFATFFCSPWEGESAQKHPPAIVRSLAKHKAQNGKEICDL